MTLKVHRLAQFREVIDKLLDSADERSDSDPSLALCEVNCAILVLSSYKEAIVSNIDDQQRREYLLEQARRTP